VIVFIGGMQRSGSTFSFNVAREILRRRGGVYQETTPHVLEVVGQAALKTPRVRHVIVKAHSIDEPSMAVLRLGGIRAICTIRRPEDAVASYMDIFGMRLETAVEEIYDWIKGYARIRPFALTVRYDLIERFPLLAAWRIALYLCPSAIPVEVASIWRRHTKSAVKASTDNMKQDNPEVRDIGFSYYDANTFYHRRHVSSIKPRLAKTMLSEAEIAVIRERMSDFLDSRGDINWRRVREDETPGNLKSDGG
jgi:hypothetical protein